MSFELPKLEYEYNALTPYIDARTMEIHHSKHHQAYITKVNDAIAGSDLESKSVEDLVSDLASVPDAARGAVRNNGGGHANHSLFWTVMSPNGGGEPGGELHRFGRDLPAFHSGGASAGDQHVSGLAPRVAGRRHRRHEFPHAFRVDPAGAHQVAGPHFLHFAYRRLALCLRRGFRDEKG